jgi:hypothetical protein
MKICKNHFDILIKSTTKCSECALRTKTRPCLWVKLMLPKYVLNCGGIRTTSLSDIFKV